MGNIKLLVLNNGGERKSKYSIAGQNIGTSSIVSSGYFIWVLKWFWLDEEANVLHHESLWNLLGIFRTIHNFRLVLDSINIGWHAIFGGTIWFLLCVISPSCPTRTPILIVRSTYDSNKYKNKCQNSSTIFLPFKIGGPPTIIHQHLKGLKITSRNFIANISPSLPRMLS